MPRSDFLFSLVLIALGSAVAIESHRMPRMAEFGYGDYAAPGIVPGIIGGILAVFGLLLLVRSARAGGSRLSAGPAQEAGTKTRLVLGLGIALCLIVVYAVVLVGQIPFWLATFLFVFAFIAYFEWSAALPAARRARVLATAFLQAVVVAVAVTFLFERVFLVQLPG